jgi:hypothetical protein
MDNSGKQRKRPIFTLKVEEGIPDRELVYIEGLLKYMKGEDIERCYGEIGDSIDSAILSPACKFGERKFIKVESYTAVDGSVLEPEYPWYYLSSGKSRGVGTGGYWLPTMGMCPIEKRLHKPEDGLLRRIRDCKYSREDSDELLKFLESEYPYIKLCGRFLTKESAHVSKFLSSSVLFSDEEYHTASCEHALNLLLRQSMDVGRNNLD